MAESIAFVDGQYVPADQAKISLFDIGFTRGDAVYDTVSVWKGWFFRLDDHVRLRNCGGDMAAHCVNAVLTCGAEPLFLLDYVAANRLDLGQVAELVEGAAEVCRAAGCALVGGEAAVAVLECAATAVGRQRWALDVVFDHLDGARIDVARHQQGLAARRRTVLRPATGRRRPRPPSAFPVAAGPHSRRSPYRWKPSTQNRPLRRVAA